MKFISNYFLQVILLGVLMSCKKTSPIEPGNVQPISEQKTTDSVSFSINSTHYSFNNTNSIGIGNRQINIKPFNEVIVGRDYAYATAGKFWYGTPDSTMYTSMFGMSSYTNIKTSLEIEFHKKYKTSDLKKSTILMIPKDQSELFKVGKQPFAIDFGKENTREGVVLSLNIQGSELSSKTPGFSIFLQSHKMDIQDNSSFEILKVDHIEGDRYLIEGRFSLNLFDKEEKLYRVEEGFIRKNINMSHNMASF